MSVVSCGSVEARQPGRDARPHLAAVAVGAVAARAAPLERLPPGIDRLRRRDVPPGDDAGRGQHRSNHPHECSTFRVMSSPGH